MHSVRIYVATLVIGCAASLGATTDALGQRLEPYQSYVETGIYFNAYGVMVSEEAYAVSERAGAPNALVARAIEDGYAAYNLGSRGYLYFHYEDIYRAADRSYEAAYWHYINYDYLWTYVIPYGPSRQAYDFTVATYYALLYNYWAGVYYEGAYFSILPF